MVTIPFYNGKICLNVLAKDQKNAQEIYEAAEGHVLIGVLASQFSTVKEAVEQIKMYQQVTDGSVSLGLGAGDPEQWKRVADISHKLEMVHVNQIYSAVGYTRARVRCSDTWVNGLVQPIEKIGYVNIATGPQTSRGKRIDLHVEDAIRFVREMGGSALKFFPMHGLQLREQYKAVAVACAEADFPLEPTGGIDLENFEEIVTIALAAGVKQIIPHVYSSIISKETGETSVEAVKRLYKIMKKAGDH